MQIITGKWRILPLLILLLTSCTKGGDTVLKPILEVKPYSISGFAVQPLDQYFDGVKVRTLHGSINASMEIAFMQEETLMELKNSTTGKVVYSQKFYRKDEEHKVPLFYYDGTTLKERYEYPAPQGAEYLANFFFDFPKEEGAADVVVVMVEYYWDETLPQGYGVAAATTIPIATNIQPGKWSDYITLPALPDFPPKSRPDGEFMPYICVKKTGSDLYFTHNDDTTATHLLNKADINSFPLELPQPGGSQGKVQSYYIGLQQFETGAMLTPKLDLVQMFP
ncbi:hypothetical protein SAMN05421788_1011122 [Filimonas lacunae]|uniref:Uncharacterized protein n=1 Tax=Filimonas lacunae TaxID=477680 RepID=A0A173MPR7_9BACT|nr:hypothetical protein [Filimonas lacunae]BAV09685.1 hypothetical protein FLA_5738 [Filimonas lacunae]SIS77231.1 hypothetical protein SAMN05421788_1011122 [Filimonas lacunae]